MSSASTEHNDAVFGGALIASVVCLSISCLVAGICYAIGYQGGRTEETTRWQRSAVVHRHARWLPDEHGNAVFVWNHETPPKQTHAICPECNGKKNPLEKP